MFTIIPIPNSFFGKSFSSWEDVFLFTIIAQVKQFNIPEINRATFSLQ